MADTFDPYREALVLEIDTLWPDDLDVPEGERARIAAALHKAPQDCQSIEYVRLHTGFCRTIAVTADDLARVRSKK